IRTQELRNPARICNPSILSQRCSVCVFVRINDPAPAIARKCIKRICYPKRARNRPLGDRAPVALWTDSKPPIQRHLPRRKDSLRNLQYPLCRHSSATPRCIGQTIFRIFAVLLDGKPPLLQYSEWRKCACQFASYFAATLSSRITGRFSAFFWSAAFVKLNEPVSTVVPSMIMILLCAIACIESTYVSTPSCARKSAAE